MNEIAYEMSTVLGNLMLSLFVSLICSFDG
jgi:hypothetical protein